MPKLGFLFCTQAGRLRQLGANLCHLYFTFEVQESQTKSLAAFLRQIVLAFLPYVTMCLCV
jgi:hypothetical protein